MLSRAKNVIGVAIARVTCDNYVIKFV